VEFPFPTYYTNAINVGTTVFEFSLLVIDRLDNENATVRSRIVMNPSHAKLLFLTLGRQIQNYETRFGEIKLPPGVEKEATASNEPEPQT